jgi:hypothetical protein
MKDFCKGVELEALDKINLSKSMPLTVERVSPAFLAFGGAEGRQIIVPSPP